MIDKSISGSTRICGIIGDPVNHSVSPAMQNAAFQNSGLDFVYVPFNVRKKDLERAVAGMRALNVNGFNVTVPHKTAVIPFLDKLDPLAEKIGAVNTVVNSYGLLLGYNTDAYGFLQSLLANGVDPAGKKVVVLGAGGASHAISFALCERKANVTILNRLSGMERAKQLASRLSLAANTWVNAKELNTENLRSVIEKADILVNTTQVGMSPHLKQTLLPAEMIKTDMVVVDIIYEPPLTRLLKEAEQRGAKIINGIDMLVFQGAQAFELWTRKPAPVAIMKRQALEELERNAKKRVSGWFHGNGEDSGGESARNEPES